MIRLYLRSRLCTTRIKSQFVGPWKTRPTTVSSSEVRTGAAADILCRPASVTQSLGCWLKKPRSVLWGLCPMCVGFLEATRVHFLSYRHFCLVLCANPGLFFLPPFAFLPFLHSFSSPFCFSRCLVFSFFFFSPLKNSPSPHGTLRLCRGKEKANE